MAAEQAKYDAWRRKAGLNDPQNIHVAIDRAKPGSDKIAITVMDNGTFHHITAERDVRRVWYKGYEIELKGKA